MAKRHPLLIDLGEGLSLMVGFPTIASWKSSQRPKKAKRGTIGFNTQTKSLEFFTGSDWYTAQMES